jgi:hypothetical protein
MSLRGFTPPRTQHGDLGPWGKNGRADFTAWLELNLGNEKIYVSKKRLLDESHVFF